MTITIRQEQINDYSITEDVVQKAFKQMDFSDKREHKLVSRLRQSPEFVPQLSIVALENNSIIGHILFTKIIITNDVQAFESLALAPIAVLPEYQNKGIGKLLIQEGLKIAKTLQYSSVIVLGHPDYYPKFGFKKASLFGIKAPFEVPEDSFMALELQKNSLANVSGVVKYSSAFFE